MIGAGGVATAARPIRHDILQERQRLVRRNVHHDKQIIDRRPLRNPAITFPVPYHRIYISAVVMCGGCETQSRVVCWLMSDPMMRGVCWYVGVNKISMQLHENV